VLGHTSLAAEQIPAGPLNRPIATGVAAKVFLKIPWESISKDGPG